MDNYRNPMYNRNHRNMAFNQNQCRNNYNIPAAMPMAETVNCGCEGREPDNCVDNMPLAMAYVPMQKWRNVLDGCNGLSKGTIFEELIMPYYGSKSACRMRGDR